MIRLVILGTLIYSLSACNGGVNTNQVEDEVLSEIECATVIMKALSALEGSFSANVNGEIKTVESDSTTIAFNEILFRRDTAEYFFIYYLDEESIATSTRVPSSIFFLKNKVVGIGYGRGVAYLSDNVDLYRLLIETLSDEKESSCAREYVVRK